MTTVNMGRLGGLYWVRGTHGRLSTADRWRLAGKQVEGSLATLKRFIPRASLPMPAGAFLPPDSRLAHQAEKALEDLGPGHDAIVGHSYRTWMFGLALAYLDRVQLDTESFYCAALLHDLGLVSPTPGEDFTRAGSDKAMCCAKKADLPEAFGETIADAICVHATPGVSPGRDGALGYYLQWGSIVDVSGFGRWQIAPRDLDTILRLHPPGDRFNETLSGMVLDEAKAVPEGRFALLVRFHLLR